MILRVPERLETEGPIVFLGGPIQGTWAWQEEAIQRIHRDIGDSIHIASPRRLLEDGQAFPQDKYFEQVNWEYDYLARAGQYGVIMFWLADEREHICERAYAQTSRYELGFWTARAARGEAKLVLGIMPGFSNEPYIRFMTGKEMPGLHIHSTLASTCSAAIVAAQTILATQQRS